MSLAIILVTLTLCANSILIKRDVVWLRSPKVTPWGKFGRKEFCPMNSFVTGMRLKMDHEHFGDNTALNGVQLICSDIYRKSETNITSSTGRFGKYGKTKHCPDGFATGFQLRSQTGQGYLRDDVAAVDFKLICLDINGTLTKLMDDGNKILPWGNWTKVQHCPEKTAVCGLSVQVDDLGLNLKLDDETSVNNINIACCDLSEPTKVCDLKSNWETMVACPNEAITCEIKLRTGITESKQLTKFRKFYDKFGFVGEFHELVMESLKVKSGKYRKKINNNSLKQILSETIVNEDNSWFKMKCEGIIQQLVVTCGWIKVYAYESRCAPDQYANKEWESSGLYFRPTSRYETIFWSYNCDFTGDNVENATTPIADCGDACLANELCTHFVWNKYNGGTCWMKGSKSLHTPVEKYGENFLCGWIERD